MGFLTTTTTAAGTIIGKSFGHRIMDWWDWDKLRNFQSWFGESEGKDILVLGAGGIGKSTLGKILSGTYDLLLDAPGHYEESTGVEVHPIVTKKGKPRKSSLSNLIIPPGQGHRRQSTWTDHLRDISDGKYKGVILVSAYGYHTLGQGINKAIHKVYKPRNPESFLSDYLEHKRDDEVAIMREKLGPRIQDNHHPMWLLNVVTKEDLWYPQRDAVYNFYATGAFGKAWNMAVKGKDENQFRTEQAHVCLTISNFTTAENECLQDCVTGYDDRKRVKSLRQLFEKIDALRNWQVK